MNEYAMSRDDVPVEDLVVSCYRNNANLENPCNNTSETNPICDYCDCCSACCKCEMVQNEEVVIDSEALYNLLSNAFYGGITSWACITKKVAPTSWEWVDEMRPDDEGSHWLAEYAINPGGAIYIRDNDDDEMEPVKLDREALDKGVQVLKEKYPHLYEEIVEGNDDANTASALVECALFGKVVYC